MHVFACESLLSHCWVTAESLLRWLTTLLAGQPIDLKQGHGPLLALPKTQNVQNMGNGKREPKLQQQTKVPKEQKQRESSSYKRATARNNPKLWKSECNQRAEATKEEELNKNRSCTKTKATREQSFRAQKASSSSFCTTAFTATHSSKPPFLP